MRKLNYKAVLQIAVLLFIVSFVIINALKLKDVDFEAYCPFGGILSIGSKLNLGTLSCSISEVQLFIGAAILVGIILIGKLFCGYLCPIGALIDLGSKIKYRVDVKVGHWLDRLLRVGKYALLFFTAYFTVTSSELWCRKYDPYFALVTGFGPDTIFLWSFLAVICVIIVSIFLVNFFWCKYLCPMGALSNIFQNSIITIPLIAIYIILRVAGVNISILWLILALCVTGALTEILRFKFYSLSPFKVVVDKNVCTECAVCSRSCPQGINVVEYTKVTHPDCTLCLECLRNCPVEDTVKVSRFSNTYLMPAVLVILVVGGLVTSSFYKIPTVSKKWGNYETAENIKKVTLTDLRSVKCYGSAMSLYRKIKRKNGIVGVDAYASEHEVVIYYDGDKVDEEYVKKAVFTPGKYKLKKFDDYKPEKLEVFEVGIRGADDLYDYVDVYRLLKENPYVCGFETHFGEPVKFLIYCELGKVSPEEIKELVEKDYYIYEREGERKKVKVNFECDGEVSRVDTVDYVTFRKRLFVETDIKFNNFETYSPESLDTLEISFPDAENIFIRRKLKYLASHISELDGVVRLRTAFSDSSVLQIFYDPSQVNIDAIFEKLGDDSINVLYSNGTKKRMPNPFNFKR